MQKLLFILSETPWEHERNVMLGKEAPAAIEITAVKGLVWLWCNGRVAGALPKTLSYQAGVIFCLSLAAMLWGGQASVLQSAAVAASQACRKEQQSPWACCVSPCYSVCHLCIAHWGRRLFIAASALAWELAWQSCSHPFWGSTLAAPFHVCWTGMGVPLGLRPGGLRASQVIFGHIYSHLDFKHANTRVSHFSHTRNPAEPCKVRT